MAIGRTKPYAPFAKINNFLADKFVPVRIAGRITSAKCQNALAENRINDRTAGEPRRLAQKPIGATGCTIYPAELPFNVFERKHDLTAAKVPHQSLLEYVLFPRETDDDVVVLPMTDTKGAINCVTGRNSRDNWWTYASKMGNLGIT